MRRTALIALVACVCLSVVVWWQSTPNALETVPQADTIGGGWQHCFCYDIEEPVESVVEHGTAVWLCNDGFFVVSVTQRLENADSGADDAGHIEGIQCCSLCR